MPDAIKELLKQQLDSYLYLHSLRTANLAVKLAKKHHLNQEHAFLAGLLHDNAKRFHFEEMREKAVRYSGYFDEYELASSALLHAPLGAMLAVSDFNVEIPEVLQAIRFHTTGHQTMTNLDKVVFLSDALEPGREFPWIEKLRQIAFHDLDHCMLLMINSTLEYLKKKKWLIHPRVYELKENIKGKLEKQHESTRISDTLR